MKYLFKTFLSLLSVFSFIGIFYSHLLAQPFDPYLFGAHRIYHYVVTHSPIVSPHPNPNDPLLGKSFSFLYIEQNEMPPMGDREDVEIWKSQNQKPTNFAEHLFDGFKTAVKNAHIQKGHPERAAAIESEGSFLDGRSNFVALTDYLDFKNVRATMRIVRKGPLPMVTRMQNLLLPEKRHEASLPDKELKKISTPTGEVAYGARVELKNWMTDQSSVADEYYFTMLWHLANQTPFFDFTGRFEEVEKTLLPILPDEFVFETMTPAFFNRFGTRHLRSVGATTSRGPFKVIKEFPEYQTTWMGTDRKGMEWIQTDMALGAGLRAMTIPFIAEDQDSLLAVAKMFYDQQETCDSRLRQMMQAQFPIFFNK